MFDRKKNRPPRELLRLMAGKLSPRAAERARDRIREQDELRRTYDRLAEGEAALEGESGALSQASVERVETRLFASLDARSAAKPARASAWFAGLALAGAAAAALLVIAPEEGKLIARSGTTEASLDANHAFSALRVRVEQGQVSVVPAEIIRSTDSLRFAAYSRDRPAQISVVLTDDRGRRDILVERAALNAGGSMARLDAAAALGELVGGSWRLVAVFEHGGPVDLRTISLEPRDEAELSVRSVGIQVETEARR